MMKLRKYQTGFWGQVIGGVIAGGLSLLGGRNRNRSQKEIAQQANIETEISTAKQMAFQLKANQKAMDFSERMSSTAHQREIVDLRRAGLNPILSSRYGGSSTPAGVTSGGTSYTAQQAQVQDIISPAVSAFQQHRQASAQVKNVNAATENLKAMQQNIRTDTILKSTQANVNQQKVTESYTNVDKMKAEIKNILVTTMSGRERIKQIKEATNLTNQQLRQLLIKFPKLKYEAHIDKSTYNKVLMWLGRLLPYNKSISAAIPSPTPKLR